MLGALPPPVGGGRTVLAAGTTASLADDALRVLAAAVPLQGGLGGVDPLQALLVAMAAASTALGLYVGYQGYRGFQRNDSVPMKFLSMGLILLTAVTYGLSFGGSVAFQYDLAPELLRPAWQVAVRGSQLAGLACIVYALYSRP
jgi:hypothetical protein